MKGVELVVGPFHGATQDDRDLKALVHGAVLERGYVWGSCVVARGRIRLTIGIPDAADDEAVKASMTDELTRAVTWYLERRPRELYAAYKAADSAAEEIRAGFLEFSELTKGTADTVEGAEKLASAAARFGILATKWAVAFRQFTELLG